MLFVCLETILCVITPTAVVLSTWIGAGFCGHFISISDCCSSTHLRVVIKRDANSASAIDDMTCLIICTIIITALLNYGIDTSSDK